jgi:hypothetical protein
MGLSPTAFPPLRAQTHGGQTDPPCAAYPDPARLATSFVDDDPVIRLAAGEARGQP